MSQLETLGRLNNLEVLSMVEIRSFVKTLDDIIKHLSETNYCTNTDRRALCIENCHLLKGEQGKIRFGGISRGLTLSKLYYVKCFPKNNRVPNLSFSLARLTSHDNRPILANHRASYPMTCLKEQFKHLLEIYEFK